MTHAQWNDRWEQGNIGFHEASVNRDLQQYWSQLAVPTGSQVLVPLCGKSIDMWWLVEQGYAVLGVELSPIAAREFFAERGLEPEVTMHGPFTQYRAGGVTVLQGDYFALTAEHVAAVRGVYDRAALIALPPELRQRYVKHWQHISPAQWAGLLICVAYDQTEMSGPPFSVTTDEVHKAYGGWTTLQTVCDRSSHGIPERMAARGLTRWDQTVYTIVHSTE